MKMTTTLYMTLAGVSAGALAACGGPAPGEGMESEMAPEPMPEIVSADQALHTAAIPAIDPETMQEAEIDKVLPAGSRCGFSYTSSSRPVLSGGTGTGVVKIHGRLVALQSDATTADALAGPITFQTEGMQLTVRPLEDKPRVRNGESRQKAEMHFEIEDGLTVGYRGWYSCSPKDA